MYSVHRNACRDFPYTSVCLAHVFARDAWVQGMVVVGPDAVTMPSYAIVAAIRYMIITQIMCDTMFSHKHHLFLSLIN